MCCVVCFLPIYSGRQVCWTYQPGHTGGRSHRIFHPPSFCGACLNFSLEEDSAIPFPRRPWSRILCTNDLIVLHLLGILFFIFFSEEKPRLPGFELTSQRFRRFRGYQLSYRGDRLGYCILYTVYCICDGNINSNSSSMNTVVFRSTK